MRAGESRRPDRLFDDPYAAAFAASWSGEAAPPASRTTTATDGRPSRAALAFHIVIRTRFFDDYLIEAVDGGCRQVVLLAAGLDTRAFRLTWPDDVHVFELDLPEVVEFKDAVLSGQRATASCRRTTVAVDLREDWPTALAAAGFQADQPTAWLVEGLLVYLDAADAASLLTRVGQLSAAGSRVSFELGDLARGMARAGDVVAPDADPVLSLWRGGLGEDPVAWLDLNGWRAGAHRMGEVAAGYGRPAPGEVRSGFVTAIRGS